MYWCSTVALGTPFYVLQGLKDFDELGLGGFAFIVSMLGLFWLIGIGLFLGAWSKAKRSYVVAVENDPLTIWEKGLFRSIRREWDRDEIKSIQVGRSDKAIDNVPRMELAIRFHTIAKVCLLSSRNNEELRWIADLLTRALRLGPGTANNPNKDTAS